MFLAAGLLASSPETDQSRGFLPKAFSLGTRLDPSGCLFESWHVCSSWINTKKIMRYLYTVSIFLAGMGLPVLAGTSSVEKPTLTTPSKTGTHYIPPATPAVAKTSAPVKKVDKKPWLVITPRVAHSSLAMTSAVHSATIQAEDAFSEVANAAASRLARVTAYWACEGDYYTRHCMSATGVRLHDGHCAVDPNIIPYGSVVEIAGVGKFLAVDTGSAVVSRTAAREGGHNSAERGAIVIDLFFEDRAAGERFAASAAKYVPICWWTPGSTGSQARAARSLFAEEDWTKIESKQL